MGNGEQLLEIAMKNNDKRSKAKTKKRANPCETDEFKGRGLRIYICGEGSRLRISMEPEGISGFQPKKNSGITTCKSRDFEITAGNCLS